MTLNRSVFAAIALGVMALHAPSSPEMAALLSRTLPSFALFFFVTAAIFAHLLRHPGVSVGRRLFAMVHDFTMISWIAAAAGESAGLLYPLYLWTILGNGFRFGARYIFTAGAIGLAGFSVVLWSTGFWALHPGLSAGLWLGLLVLPLYVSRLLRQLSQATHEAQQASRAKSAFLASVSHELRTPLNAVIGLSDLLAQQPLTRDQLGSVRLIRSAGQSLLELINTLLDFSRLEAGRMPMRKARFDVVEVAASLRAMMAPQAQEKGLTLALQVAADAPRLVEADRKHVQEILFNLVGNALKFTRDGHVLLRLLAGPREEGRAWLTIEVEDTGVGIAPEAQARIFESFAQADETILDRFGGTGLGLAICKQLAELMGGRISVRSTPGHGSTFAVELPVGVDPPEAEAAPATAPESARVVAAGADMGFAARLRAAHGDAGSAATPAELRTLLDGASGPSVVFLPAAAPPAFAATLAELRSRGARLALARVAEGDDADIARLPIDHVTAVPRRADAVALGRAARLAYDCVAAGEDAPPPAPVRAARPLSLLVAEDNATNRIVIKAILEGAGHTVALVEDGEAALDALAERSFDVVIMDVNMPGMNGLEAARLYRVQALGGRAAPIIGLTADASEEMQRKCRAAGMAAYASKPVSAGQLVALIDEVAAGRENVARPTKPTPTPPSDALREDRARELERLGGAGFADGLSRQFVGQAEEGLAALRRAFERGDLDAFRRHAHHLKSAAGAVGADQVAWRCDRFQDLDRDAFALLSGAELDALGREIDAYRGRAERRFARAPAATPG